MTYMSQGSSTHRRSHLSRTLQQGTSRCGGCIGQDLGHRAVCQWSKYCMLVLCLLVSFQGAAVIQAWIHALQLSQVASDRCAVQQR